MTHRLLLLDFDGTITSHDTLSSLITLAIETTSTDAPNSPNKTTRTTTLKTNWHSIVTSYLASHKAHVASYRPRAEDRTTLAEELAFLESAGDVERASVERVGRAGFFGGGFDCSREGETPEGGGEQEGEGQEGGEGKRGLVGLGRVAFERGVGGGDGDEPREREDGAVRLRKGFGKFLERQAKDGWDLAVVSVNWSGEFIRGVVEAACEAGGGEGEKKVRRIMANRVTLPEGTVQGPEELGGEPLTTAGDKLRAMESLRGGLGEEKVVVYFGDSTTDLACLVEADLGVVMADDGGSKLLKTLERVGYEVPHVMDAGGESGLVWARDFEEVLESSVLQRI
ncbi:uncharacterized protein C8A04DRAFT_13100 [Dichotomopilus funicola]|uniref:Uncharacterized protein n=1 Tax=Dichotomopilus funicola TaxID=1934379 RepID=A0AAN6ZKH3_9PEZI|nr:hypothetical protein C8A04DRAFT_13100 [Dichotomopilus funicola]